MTDILDIVDERGDGDKDPASSVGSTSKSIPSKVTSHSSSVSDSLKTMKILKHLGLNKLHLETNPASRQEKFQWWMGIVITVVSTYHGPSHFLRDFIEKGTVHDLPPMDDQSLANALRPFIDQSLFNSFPPCVQKSAVKIITLLSVKFGNRGEDIQRDFRDRIEKLGPERFPDLVLYLTTAQRYLNAANSIGVGMSEEVFIGHVIRNLGRCGNTKHQVRSELLSTPGKVPATIQDLEAKFAKWDKEDAMARKRSRNRFHANTALDHIPDQESPPHSIRSNGTETNPERKQKKQPNNRNLFCLFCGRSGHLDIDCFRKKNGGEIVMIKSHEDKTCKLCNTKGHLMPFCPLLPANKNRKYLWKRIPVDQRSKAKHNAASSRLSSGTSKSKGNIPRAKTRRDLANYAQEQLEEYKEDAFKCDSQDEALSSEYLGMAEAILKYPEDIASIELEHAAMAIGDSEQLDPISIGHDLPQILQMKTIIYNGIATYDDLAPEDLYRIIIGVDKIEYANNTYAVPSDSTNVTESIKEEEPSTHDSPLDDPNARSPMSPAYSCSELPVSTMSTPENMNFSPFASVPYTPMSTERVPTTTDVLPTMYSQKSTGQHLCKTSDSRDDSNYSSKQHRFSTQHTSSQANLENVDPNAGTSRRRLNPSDSKKLDFEPYATTIPPTMQDPPKTPTKGDYDRNRDGAPL